MLVSVLCARATATPVGTAGGGPPLLVNWVSYSPPAGMWEHKAWIESHSPTHRPGIQPKPQVHSQ